MRYVAAIAITAAITGALRTVLHLARIDRTHHGGAPFAPVTTHDVDVVGRTALAVEPC